MSKTSERKDGEASLMQFLLERADDTRQSVQETANRRASTAMVRDEIFLDHFKDLLKEIFPKGPVQAKKHRPNAKRRSTTKKRIANGAFSDLHFHSMLDPRELPLQYGPVEEARRLSLIVSELCEYKPQYRDDTELFMHWFGDIIQGMLHDPRDAATMTEQFGAAVHLLTQTVVQAASAFDKVTVRCVPGNHGRNKQRHPDRATTQKWDSFENMIYLAVKYAVATLPNVEIIIPYTPYYTYEAFDKIGFVTHGDTVLDVGFPSSTIDIKKIRNQVNEWNAGDVNHDLFLVGHVHCGAMVHLPSGPVFMSNGPLIPPDGYAISRGMANTNCGQWLWESVEGHIVGDARYISVNESTDKDESLKIIKPFYGFKTESPLKR
jgi:hypothetical protein